MRELGAGKKEFWATQLVGSEDGNYFMSESKDLVEKMSTVEISFKVIGSDYVEQLEKEKAELQQYKKMWQSVAGKANLRYIIDENRQLLEEIQDILEKCFYVFENQPRPNMNMAETVNNLHMKIEKFKLGGGG